MAVTNCKYYNTTFRFYYLFFLFELSAEFFHAASGTLALIGDVLNSNLKIFTSFGKFDVFLQVIKSFNTIIMQNNGYKS